MRGLPPGSGVILDPELRFPCAANAVRGGGLRRHGFLPVCCEEDGPILLVGPGAVSAKVRSRFEHVFESCPERNMGTYAAAARVAQGTLDSTGRGGLNRFAWPRNLFTVARFSERRPAWTQAALRHLISDNADRLDSLGDRIPGTGLAEAGAAFYHALPEPGVRHPS